VVEQPWGARRRCRLDFLHKAPSGRLRRRCGALRCQQGSHGTMPCRAGGVGWWRKQGKSSGWHEKGKAEAATTYGKASIAGEGEGVGEAKVASRGGLPEQEGGRRRDRQRREKGKAPVAGESRGGSDDYHEGFGGLVGCGG
jgi:hypothetical protein